MAQLPQVKDIPKKPIGKPFKGITNKALTSLRKFKNVERIKYVSDLERLEMAKAEINALEAENEDLKVEVEALKVEIEALKATSPNNQPNNPPNTPPNTPPTNNP